MHSPLSLSCFGEADFGPGLHLFGVAGVLGERFAMENFLEGKLQKWRLWFCLGTPLSRKGQPFDPPKPAVHIN
jgi:hypothetical protein